MANKQRSKDYNSIFLNPKFLDSPRTEKFEKVEKKISGDFYMELLSY